MSVAAAAPKRRHAEPLAPIVELFQQRQREGYDFADFARDRGWFTKSGKPDSKRARQALGFATSPIGRLENGRRVREYRAYVSREEAAASRECLGASEPALTVLSASVVRSRRSGLPFSAAWRDAIATLDDQGRADWLVLDTAEAAKVREEWRCAYERVETPLSRAWREGIAA